MAQKDWLATGLETMGTQMLPLSLSGKSQWVKSTPNMLCVRMLCNDADRLRPFSPLGCGDKD
jgi:hypothetical protein